MSDKNVVEIVNYFCVDKTPYKYAYKDVLVCISTLFYKGNVKSTVYYVVGSSDNFKDDACQLVVEAFNWVYSSLKSTKFELKQSFIFDTTLDVQNFLKAAIKKYSQENNIKASYSLSYVLRDVVFKDQFTDVRRIFSFDTMLPLAIGFNVLGFYNISLKDEAIIRLSEIKFLY
ncbi:hypothetical protein [Acinetobacter gandensis]|uniref:hypothetical protein n=1 Tax=Acinetobacter gandensis TaxID=1443941 RepID=UPI00398A4F7A